MRTVTATEASRSFAALLDSVESGETVVVTRGGQRIATITPANASNGGQLLDLLGETTDDSFAADITAARDSAEPSGSSWRDG